MKSTGTATVGLALLRVGEIVEVAAASAVLELATRTCTAVVVPSELVSFTFAKDAY